MSADARVARAIRELREVDAWRQVEPHPAPPAWLSEYVNAVNELVDEVKDTLHLTDEDINRY